MEKIKIYSTPVCVYCKMAKSYFDKIGVAYEDIDVSENEDAAKEMVEKTEQMGVPVIKIGEEYVVGFNRAVLETILKKNGFLKEE